MAKLGSEDKNRLLKALDRMPLLQSYRGRLQVLQRAGLETVVPQIDLDGATFIVVGEIVTILENYGRISYDHEALGRFLNVLKETIGDANEVQQHFDYLLDKYALMTPAKVSSENVDWKSSGDTETVFEKIIGEDTLRHISFLTKALAVSRAVALINVRKWTGTGFVIGRNLLMTNNHVLPQKELLSNSVARFNYQLSVDGQPEQAYEFELNPTGVFITNEQLDYTIFQTKEAVGDRWGILDIANDTPTRDARINIIQHPAGLPKKISFQNNYVEYSDENVIQYVASTLPGSSGSPVFDDQWKVAGIHHAGGMITEPKSNRRYYRNEGITMKRILQDLPPTILKAITTPQGTN